jgi:hypothetical protein
MQDDNLSYYDLKAGKVYQAFDPNTGKWTKRHFRIRFGALENDAGENEGRWGLCRFIPNFSKFKEVRPDIEVQGTEIPENTILGFKEGTVYRSPEAFEGRAVTRQGKTLYFVDDEGFIVEPVGNVNLPAQVKFDRIRKIKDLLLVS